MRVSRVTSRPTQQGMVSILITMIIMLVISLIVLGFAQVSRREQRQVLDRNLSTEAFYAAESGVNDAIDAIKSQPYGANIDKSTCDVGTSASPVTYLGKALKPGLDSNGNVAYTCMLVNSSTLTDIPLQNVPADGGSAVAPVNPNPPNPLSRIRLKWTVDSGPSNPSSCTSGATFKQATNWGSCPYGVLRVDLVPTDTLTRTSLDTGQKTVFLYPTNSAGHPPVAFAGMDGTAQPMNCSAANGCTIDIRLPLGGPVNYSLRAMAIYKSDDLDIEGLDSSLTPQVLKNAQAQIDVTGRAQDVLRRIQVRIPLLKQGDPSNYAIESASSICKRFHVGNGIFDVPDNALKNDTNNPMCKLVPAPPPPPPPGPPGPPPCPPQGCGGNKCSIGYDIILALDHSGSMYNPNDMIGNQLRIQKLQQVMTQFVQNTNVGNAKSQNHEGIIWFSGGTDDLYYTTSPGQTLTGNIPALLQSINGISQGTGTTYQPPMQTAQLQGWLPNNGGRPGSHKILVFVTDGLDEDPNDQALATATANYMRNNMGVTIYSIGISNITTYFKGLMDIANQPSSTYFINATQPADLDSMFNKIAAGVQCG